MTTYQVVLYIHLSCAVFSISFFIIRGFWMVTESDLLHARITGILPHIVDTLLLSAAVGLVFITHQYPQHHLWLISKIIALVVYIGLGMIALKYGKSKQVRSISLVGAILTFSFIVSAALLRNPFGYFSLAFS